MKKAIAIILSIMLVLAITLPAAAITSIAVKSIKLNNSKITLKVGETSNLKVTFTPANTSQKKLIYVTGNKNVATVNSAGVITGVHAGTTTITVLTPNKKIFAKCNVTIPQLARVKLSWYYGGAQQSDIQSVENAMNKILNEKINATITLKLLDWGSYEQKIKVMTAASEPFDMCFTSSWMNNYYGNVNKDAFIPLDDLLNKYAPKLMQTIPEKMWRAAKVKGKIYAVLNYQIFAMTNGLYFQKKYVDKYNIDISKIKKLADLGPALETFKTNEQDMMPIAMNKNGYISEEFISMGIEEIAGRNVPGVIYFKDAALKVINQFETPEYKAHFKLMRDWYTKGYFKKDVATISDTYADGKAGKIISAGAGNYKPGGPEECGASWGGVEMVGKQLSQPYLQTSSIIATMTAISRTSKNPERSMMFFELMNSDKELYNTMCYGIEGKHYNKISEDTIEPIANSGYNPNSGWEYGNQFNAYYTKGQKPGLWEETIKVNNEALPSPLLGFNFDPNPIKSELAQCQSVLDEYMPILMTGTVDPDEYLPKFLDKLKKAGSEKIIAEEQKQIDGWSKTK